MSERRDERTSAGARGEVEPRIARDLDRLRASREGEALDALFRSLEADAARSERSWVGRLRASATSTRRAIALASFVAIALFTFATTRRPDLAVYPLARFALECAAYGVLLATSLLLAVRPQHVPSLRPGVVLGFTGATLAAALVLAAMPPAHPLPIELVGGYRTDWASGLPCLGVGLLLGLPVYFVARLLDRGTPLSSVLAAAAAGLMGNLVLELHCPSVDPRHRLVAHASIGFVFLLALAVAYGLESLLSRRTR